jgi:hypothetical protein
MAASPDERYEAAAGVQKAFGAVADAIPFANHTIEDRIWEARDDVLALVLTPTEMARLDREVLFEHDEIAFSDA